MARDHFLLEELDEATVAYLRAIRRSRGVGLPGVYVPATGVSVGCVFAIGAAVICATLYAVWPPLNDPTNMTLLLTAGLLLGGWLVVAAARVLLARGRGNNLGAFHYADPWHLWSVNGIRVDHFALEPVRAVQLIENQDGNGGYQNSTLKLFGTGFEVHHVIQQMVGAREIHAYLQYWSHVREGGPLSRKVAEQLAASAWADAYNQEMPADTNTALDIPEPQRVRRAAFGWLNLLGVAAAAVGLFLLLQPLVLAWRDDAIFEMLRRQGPGNLRAYLIDPRNTRHRNRVHELLAQHYEPKVAALQEDIRNNADPRLADVADPMGALLLTVARAPQPIVTVRVREKPSPIQFAGLANGPWVQSQLADALISAIGPELLAVAEAPAETPALIEFDYQIVADKGAATYHLDCTLTLRQRPNDDPLLRRSWQSGSCQPVQVPTQLRQMIKAFTGNDPGGALP